MSEFASIVSVGGLLPSDVLARVAAGDSDLEGVGPESYGLVSGERLNDHVTRSWNRLTALWLTFNEQLEALSESELTATSLTRERWLRPLFDELGFAGLEQARSRAIDGKDYAISHKWGSSVPVHLLGARVPVDRRSPGIPGASASSPHGLIQEFLNRSDDHLWAVVTNGLTLRILRDNASLTRQAYVEFDLEAIFDGELYSDFVVLWLTCHRTRFEGDPPEKCLLEQWSQEAASAGTRALDKLRDGVEAAIVALGEGFLAHPANGQLRDDLISGRVTTADYQRQLLRVVYRLLFLLVAEARDLLLAPDTDEARRARYRDFYSISRLVGLARVRRGSPHDDLWDGLSVTMRALWHEGEVGLGLAPLGSSLWSPDSVGALGGARLDNRHVLDAVRSLSLVRDVESKVDRAIDYRNLGAEELGSVYESLLELHAVVDASAKTFTLGTAAGSERKTTGSYYTPTSLISELLDSALDPVLDEAAKSDDPESAILGLSVVDPACGSGHFLIAAAHRIALRLAGVRAGGIEPAPDDVRSALREVVAQCVHGIDINPMAVELCKVSLWLEATEPGKPLSFLDHRIACGNSLLGTTPELMADGIPDVAFKPLEGDDKKTVTSLKNRNKAERQGQGVLGFDEGSIAAATEAAAESIVAIDELPQDTVDDVAAKAELFGDFSEASAVVATHLAADAWCAAFVNSKRPGEPPITTATVQQFATDPALVPSETATRVRELAGEYQLLHLHLTFPNVFVAEGGGFDVVLGNPPWERVKLQEKEWFSERDPEVASAANAASRKRLIAGLEDTDPGLFSAFVAAKRQAEGVSHFLRQSGRFPLCGRGDVNTYTVFAELMRAAVGSVGRVGVIVPSGIATDDTTKFFFQDLVECRSLVSLFDFENRKKIFAAVDSRMKFCLLTLSGVGRPVDEAEFVFFALETADLNDVERRFTLSPDDFVLLNPNTRTCPIFRSRRDAEITKGIYRRVPVLVDENDPDGNPWGVTFQRMFDMANDSHLFRTREQLESDGWTLHGNIFTRGDDRYLPLYEGKMVTFFDHRAADVVRSPTAVQRQNQPEYVDVSQKLDASRLAVPMYWVPAGEVQDRKPSGATWLLGFANVTSVTNERTMVCAPIPIAGVAHSEPLIIAERGNAMLMAVLASFCFDYISRQKVGGVNFTYGYVKQIPVPVRAIDVDQLVATVVELAYTAWDLGGIASDSGYQGAPFRWDVSRRELLQAELNARMFRAYGVDRHDVDYILNSFKIVRRKEEAQMGTYRTKSLILDCFDAMVLADERGEKYRSSLDPPPGAPSLRHDPSTRPEWADFYESVPVDD